jgi:hypothetical protein
MGQLLQDLIGLAKVILYIAVFAVAVASCVVIIVAALITEALRRDRTKAQDILDKPLIK